MANFHLAVILNGPAGCGKDTLAERLTDYGFAQHEFKHQLYEETARLFKMTTSTFKELATDRELKERQHINLRLGRQFLSPRSAMIYTSEHVIKPKHGSSFFGLAAADRCRYTKSMLAVFSDCGFKEELVPLQNLYRNVVLVRLYRDGFSFDGDSRNYLHGFENTYDLQLTDGDIDGALESLLNIVDRYLPIAVALQKEKGVASGNG